MKNIWFSSDFHYGHKNICRGVSTWSNLKYTRDFQSIEEMNYTLVNNINSYVKKDDDLYFLGDWSFGGIENIWEFRKKLNCNNIHFICGNHDNHIKLNKNILSSDKSAKELFTSVHNYLELEINGQIFVLMHYPVEEWYEMDRKGSIMLHGHCHHKLDNSELNTYYRRMDVGIDWEEFRPFSFEEIINKMKNRTKKVH